MRPVDGGRRILTWGAAAAVALVGVSRWLDTPRVEYLAVCAIATAVAIAFAVRLRGSLRLWPTACAGGLAIAVLFAGDAQRRLSMSERAWRAASERSARAANDALAREVRATLAALRSAAARAVEVAPGTGPGRAQTFGQMARLAHGPEERGVILFHNDSAAAWAGAIRVLPADGGSADSVGIATSPFYLALYATAEQGDNRALATALVHAAPPADRLARALSSRVIRGAGISEFAFAPAADSAQFPDAAVVRTEDGKPLFLARASTPERGEARLHLLEQVRVRVGVTLILALLAFLLSVWRASRQLAWRLSALGVAIACTALAPLNDYSNLSRFFDPTLYYTPLGRALTANAGALAITSALVLLGLLAIFRRHGRRPGRLASALIVLLVAGLGPFLLRDLARGIHMPSYGASGALWLIWEIPLFLAAVSVLLVGATAGGVLLGRSRGLPWYVGPALAAAAALMGPMVWGAPAGWPWWYTFLWVAAIAALALSRESRGIVLGAATVAALGATTLVWANTARGRVALARNDLASLSEPDPTLADYLDRFARSLADEPVATTRQGLLQQFVTSDLAAAGYPVQLMGWESDTAASAVLQTAAFEVPGAEVGALVREALLTGRPVSRRIRAWPAVELAVAVPAEGAGATAVVAAPRTRLISGDPYSRLIGLDPGPSADPPYTLQLVANPSGAIPQRTSREQWRREGNELHGDYVIQTGTGVARAHVEIELRSNLALLQRGVLIVLLNLAIVAALWSLNVAADGGIGRWFRARQRTWRRSYRARLTLALFAFFVIPASVFAVWSYRQLLVDARQTRMLLVHETLRAVTPPGDVELWIAGESGRLDTPLLLYNGGQLEAAGDPLHESLAPVGRFLRPDVEQEISVADELTSSKDERVGPKTMLFGYRALEGNDRSRVLAAPARSGDVTVDRRRRDLGILVLFTTAVGALAALLLSGVAARQLAQPVGTLRGAALAIAAGEREPPLEGEPTVEFEPVFAAFRRMASDLNASRTALEAAQRRLAAVLRNVASGVIAVDAQGRVVIANPRADAILGAGLPPGTQLADVAAGGLAEIIERFIVSGREEEDFELHVRDRQIRGRVTRLGDGAVLTLDDVSDLARAQRVLAWGEMARQVAHEIKNPLTPIRLGVQHLRRARADTRVDFDKVLDQNVSRILNEIDRLDEIARAFSRYGTVPEERAPAEPTDVAAVVRDIVALENMGEGEVKWTVAGAEEPRLALARGDELREVLLNVLENARLANAKFVDVTLGHAADDGGPEQDGRIEITVRDDGYGIPAEVLPRIFEPHFSTRTSGSGLGLAVSRRLIESWGGDIGVESEPGKGTSIRILLRAVN
jgi:two-component system, NtrC family, nitrogen regulation sensor histidine kinase NtrY